ncbi:L-lactate permease [Comamonas sp. JC664]|uniref:L-lactate permease n=1 Tax=Comamonas sp. JC664 TaxID=2801917 RepID=UPI00361C5769
MAIMDGWRGVKETWPAVLVGGGSFAIVQFLTANYIGPELPISPRYRVLDCADPVPQSLAAQAHLRFTPAGEPAATPCPQPCGRRARPDAVAVIKAWSPFIILTAGHGLEHQALQGAVCRGWPAGVHRHQYSVPFLHNLVEKTPPVVAAAAPYGAVYTFNWLLATVPPS